MNDEKNNILIISDDASGVALSKKLKTYSQVGKIFIAPNLCAKSDLCDFVDIREDNETDLLKFALSNDIKLTIIASEKAMKADVATFFQANGQSVFAPGERACLYATNKVSGKKFLHKIHAQISKFGVFDKPQQAIEWINSANFPICIRSCENIKTSQDRIVAPTKKFAVDFIQTLFNNGENLILTEEFINGHNFTVYFITDGYGVLHLASVKNYKFEKDGDCGLYKNGMGCIVPDYMISSTVVSRVKNIVQKMLDYLAQEDNPYMGIIGVECTITGEDKFYVNEFKPFLQDYDATAVLNSVDDNLYKIMKACADGLFADEYENIVINENASVSLVLSSDKIINSDNFDDDTIDITQNSANKYIITKYASNITRAKQSLSSMIKSCYEFSKGNFRRDIIKDFEC